MVSLTVVIDGVRYTHVAGSVREALQLTVQRCVGSGWSPAEITVPDGSPVTTHDLRQAVRGALLDLDELVRAAPDDRRRTTNR